jgi:pantoate--beta-alanine ligase
MKVITTPEEMQAISQQNKFEGKKIAVVPTMGFLHNGHLTLVKKAKEVADIVITTLFVNPKQFAPNEDFERYPRDFERDKKLLIESGCDYLFSPDISSIYPIDFATSISIGGVTKVFEGESRPNHFDGVALIVLKLFNITLADIGLFGQKDYQQTLVIKKLVKDLNVNIKLLITPTVREANGLAMSSRNRYLTDEEKNKASIIFLSLEEARKAIAHGERRRKMINSVVISTLRSIPEIKIDYVATVKSENLELADEFLPGEEVVILIACFINQTRLIDNTIIKIPTAFTENFIE